MSEYKPSFPNERKIVEEAHEVNEKVDAHFLSPKTDKSRSKSEIAHKIIKEMPSKPVRFSAFSGEDLEWMKGLRKGGVRLLEDGFLEIKRWDKTAGQDPEKISQKVDGINSAIRMQDHILEQYGLQSSAKPGEVEQLESIQEIIDKADQLLNRWKMARSDEKEEIQTELAKIVLQLESCRNEFKVNVRDQAEEVVGLRDSRGRENPSALAARTVAALNNLEKRFGEMRIIKPRIAMRKELLVFEKKRSEMHIRRAASQVALVLHHTVFKDLPSSGPAGRIQDYEMQYLDLAIGKALHHLQNIYVAPYKQQADQAEFVLLQNVKRFLKSKKSLLDNRESLRANLQDVLGILNSDMSKFG